MSERLAALRALVVHMDANELASALRVLTDAQSVRRTQAEGAPKNPTGNFNITPPVMSEHAANVIYGTVRKGKSE